MANPFDFFSILGNRPPVTPLNNLAYLLSGSMYGSATALDSYEFNLLLQESIGSVKVGIKEKETVSELVEQSQLNGDEVCTICLEKLKAEEPVEVERKVRMTLCKHLYCETCIFQWLDASKKCPNCGVDLEEALGSQV